MDLSPYAIPCICLYLLPFGAFTYIFSLILFFSLFTLLAVLLIIADVLLLRLWIIFLETKDLWAALLLTFDFHVVLLRGEGVLGFYKGCGAPRRCWLHLRRAQPWPAKSLRCSPP